MYTRRRLVGCQAAIASKLGFHSGSGSIREKQVGCQADFASKFGSYKGICAPGRPLHTTSTPT